MNVKRGTQTFSKAEQTSGLKSDGSNVNGAEDFQKAFGDQDLGAVLNKVADANWVDPAKKTRAVGNNQLGKDAFLKLMLAQMKHQDPTNPMQSHEMAAQLAQFTSLEQLNNINTTLEGMRDAQAPSTNFQMLAFIGKKVSGDSSKLSRAAGDTKHAFNFELLGDTSKVKVTVKDAAGNVVRKMDFANLKKGQNSIEWNGLGEDGLPSRAGEYKFVVEATAPTGAKVFAKTSFEGRITGLNYGSGGPVLMVGDQSIKMSDVKKIEEAAPEDLTPMTPLGLGGAAALPSMKKAPLKPEQTKASSSPTQAKLQADRVKEEAEAIPPAPDEDDVPQGNIGDVPMAGDLLNRLQKETS